MLFPSYTVVGVENSDKLQMDLASQCSTIFNIPIRPEIQIETLVNGKVAVKVKVYELPIAQKPLFFKSEGLPKGA